MPKDNYDIDYDYPVEENKEELKNNLIRRVVQYLKSNFYDIEVVSHLYPKYTELTFTDYSHKFDESTILDINEILLEAPKSLEIDATYCITNLDSIPFHAETSKYLNLRTDTWKHYWTLSYEIDLFIYPSLVKGDDKDNIEH